MRLCWYGWFTGRKKSEGALSEGNTVPVKSDTTGDSKKGLLGGQSRCEQVHLGCSSLS